MLHRMGHGLLAKATNGAQRLLLSRSVRLPVKLTLSQFIWMLEILVATAVFSGLLAKRCFLTGDSVGILAGVVLFAAGLALFFLPVHLGRLWIECYAPPMTLVGPTDGKSTDRFPACVPHSCKIRSTEPHSSRPLSSRGLPPSLVLMPPAMHGIRPAEFPLDLHRRPRRVSQLGMNVGPFGLS
jgi:hypothetical protein